MLCRLTPTFCFLALYLSVLSFTPLAIFAPQAAHAAQDAELITACRQGDDAACIQVATLFGADQQRLSTATMLDILSDACDHQAAHACSFRAVLLIQTMAQHSLEENDVILQQALTSYKAACALKLRDACFRVGLMYQENLFGTDQHTVYLSYFKQACRLELWHSCRVLAALYVDAAHPFHDLQTAAHYAEDACRQEQHAKACTLVGTIYFSKQDTDLRDPRRALPFLKFGCAGDVGDACHLMAVAYATGDGTPENAVEAYLYAQRSCALGSEAGCEHLGSAFKLKRPGQKT